MKNLLLPGIILELLFVVYRLIDTGPAQTVIKYMTIFSISFIVLIFVYRKAVRNNKVFSSVFSVCSVGSINIILIFLFALLFQLTLMPSAPEMSDDIYRYIWDGKLQCVGINPYAYAPDDPVLNAYHSETLPSLVNFPRIKTIYPPIAQLVFRLSYMVFGEGVTGMKFLFILFQLGACLVFYLLLRERKANPALLLLFAWNPLVVMETAVNGHLDIVMVFFLLLCLLFFYKEKYILSGVFFGAAVLSKLIPIVLLPLFLFYLFLKKENGFRKSGSFLISFLLTITFFYAFYIDSAGNMFLTALNYSSKWYFNNPLFHIIHFFTESNALAHLISFSLFIAVFLFIFLRSLPFEKKIFYTTFAFVFLNPTIHPWYLVILIGLQCIYFSDIAILWSGLVIVSYVVVYRFKITGDWTDSWLQLVLQYTSLLIFAVYKLAVKTRVERD